MASQQAPATAKDQVPRQEGSTSLEGTEAMTTTLEGTRKGIAYWEQRLGRGPQIIRGRGIDLYELDEWLYRRFGDECFLFVTHNQYHVYAERLLTREELLRQFGRCELEEPKALEGHT
ncbi:hypothetical protein NKR23_g10906 [Pleurostoma richardsiae]|uniref:Uncharacterized protein n=1 Tax=Pleurostoma richardsiae TaxID=41990 RepID=A0AA38R4E3_9PEZI|nr:hypothetical protein NKR23_g10906 [Pleurostoma richardsiae]